MDLEALHNKIDRIQRDVDALQNQLKTCRIQVENEAEKRHIKLEHKVKTNSDDINTHKKIINYVSVAIGGAILLAILNVIGL